MLEFITVQPPPVFPQACVCCTGTVGKMADTHRELHPYGRVYVCQSCAKRLAMVFGLIDGEEADAIGASLERLATVERDLAATIEQRDKATARADKAEGRVLDLEDERTVLNGRIDQLTERLTESARADLELISNR